MSLSFNLSFEVIRGLQILAAIVVLIWFRERIVFPRRFGWSLLLVCASALLSALMLVGGADPTPSLDDSGGLRVFGFSGLIEAVSLFLFFFSFLDWPWEGPKAERHDKPKPRPRPAAKKATTRKKRKTGEAKGE
jgi:hypothetical protein